VPDEDHRYGLNSLPVAGAVNLLLGHDDALVLSPAAAVATAERLLLAAEQALTQQSNQPQAANSAS
jgi:hypothetical protein